MEVSPSSFPLVTEGNGGWIEPIGSNILQTEAQQCAELIRKHDNMKTLVEILDEVRGLLDLARKDALQIGADNIIDKIDSAGDLLNEIA